MIEAVDRVLADEAEAEAHAAVRAAVLPGVRRPVGAAPDDDLAPLENDTAGRFDRYVAAERNCRPAAHAVTASSFIVCNSPVSAQKMIMRQSAV